MATWPQTNYKAKTSVSAAMSDDSFFDIEKASVIYKSNNISVATVDAAGNIPGWAYRNISPSILAQRGAVLGKTGDSQGYEASQNLPYAFGARVTEYVTHPSPIPVGFWRSVGAAGLACWFGDG